MQKILIYTDNGFFAGCDAREYPRRADARNDLSVGGEGRHSAMF